MGSKVGKLLGAAAPLAGFIPGIGPLAAAAIGAGGGLLSGGGLKGALSGALSGGLTAGGGGLLGKALTGVESAGSAALGGGLLGAGAGGARGGLKGALLGGAAGGIGSYAGAGGFDGLGESLGLTGADGIFGEAASNYGQYGPTQTGATLSQPGSGILGAVSRTGADLGNALGFGTGGGASAYGGGSGGSYLGAGLGAINSLNANEEAQDYLLEGQRGALGQLSPYLNSGNAANNKLSSLLGLNDDPATTQQILASSPGYQFQLDQGEQALGRKQAASGNYFSGRALKEAQEFGQGLANQTASEYYTKLAQQSGQGLNAAGGAANIYGNIGENRAGATISNSNILNRTLSSLLGGSGAYGMRNPYLYGY